MPKKTTPVAIPKVEVDVTMTSNQETQTKAKAQPKLSLRLEKPIDKDTRRGLRAHLKQQMGEYLTKNTAAMNA